MAERPLIGPGLFLTNGRVVNYQRVRTNQVMDTLMEYTCLSILPVFPRVRGKPDHVSSQGKEAIFATHDIYMLCTNVASLVSHILLCSLYMRHSSCDNTDHILYKILKAMLTAFITTNTRNSGIPSAKANSITRSFPPLFMIKLPEEEHIVEELQEIESMQIVVQVIMIIVSVCKAFIVLYYCCKKCRHMYTMFKYCFPFLPISRILRTSYRTDLFVEVSNLMKGNTIWVHFMATGYFPTNIHLSRPILKESVRI